MGKFIAILIISVVIILIFTWLLCQEDDRDLKIFALLIIVVFTVEAAFSIRDLVNYGKPAPEYEKVIVTDTAPVIDTTFTTTSGVTDTTYTIKIKRIWK